MMSTTPTRHSAARVLAVLTWLTTAALAIVTNYATQEVPDWLKDRPVVSWITLACLIIFGAWVTGRAAGDGGNEQVRPKQRWSRIHRSARMVNCLACGKKGLVAIDEGQSGSWQCPKCGQCSALSMDSAARITIATPGYGKIRYTQRTQLFGLLTKIYQSEVLERAKPAADAHGDANESGATAIVRSIDGMFKREFRAAFIRGLLLDRRKRIVGWSVIGSFLVPLGNIHGAVQFGWHFAVGFAICAMLGVGQLWLRGWRTFGHWVGSREALYCWLQCPQGIALAVLADSSGEYFFEAVRILGGPAAEKLGVQLTQDICRYADREGLTLSINASDPEWLIDNHRFERALEQRRRGYTTLVRRPPKNHKRSTAGRRKRSRENVKR